MFGSPRELEMDCRSCCVVVEMMFEVLSSEHPQRLAAAAAAVWVRHYVAVPSGFWALCLSASQTTHFSQPQSHSEIKATLGISVVCREPSHIFLSPSGLISQLARLLVFYLLLI